VFPLLYNISATEVLIGVEEKVSLLRYEDVAGIFQFNLIMRKFARCEHSHFLIP